MEKPDISRERLTLEKTIHFFSMLFGERAKEVLPWNDSFGFIFLHDQNLSIGQ